MRISDWSSDVCSSDLLAARAARHRKALHRQRGHHALHQAQPSRRLKARSAPRLFLSLSHRPACTHTHTAVVPGACPRDPLASARGAPEWDISTTVCRSEEHTSELQSLMRLSYVAFCLRKILYT